MVDTAQQYLEAQVMTATPQKLRLMLIEGAIRFARQAVAAWDEKRNEDALEALNRCRDIVSELLAGIRVDQTDLTRKVAGIYLYLFRAITEAQLRRSSATVADILGVLELERQTWQMVCEQLPAESVAVPGSGPSPGAPVEIVAPAQGIGGPAASAFTVDA